MTMTLDTIIEPEIINDELAAHLTELAARPAIKTIIESGSSDGRGSTTALVNGMMKNPEGKRLYCIEMGYERYVQLHNRFLSLAPMVETWRGSSVHDDGFMKPSEVVEFYQTHTTSLNKYPLTQVLGWLEQDLVVFHSLGHDQTNLIGDCIYLNKGLPDMAVLDGSAFTGLAEMWRVFGAKIIVLDDVNDIKHFDSRQNLMRSTDYHLLAENLTLRNGYSIFEKNV